jgi:hypothetical protein
MPYRLLNPVRVTITRQAGTQNDYGGITSSTPTLVGAGDPGLSAGVYLMDITFSALADRDRDQQWQATTLGSAIVKSAVAIKPPPVLDVQEGDIFSFSGQTYKLKFIHGTPQYKKTIQYTLWEVQ